MELLTTNSISCKNKRQLSRFIVLICLFLPDETVCNILSIQEVCECLSTSAFTFAIVSLNARLSWVSSQPGPPANSSTLARLSIGLKKSAGYASSQNLNSLRTLLSERHTPTKQNKSCETCIHVFSIDKRTVVSTVQNRLKPHQRCG